MGSKHRLWACLGYGWIIDDDARGVGAVELLLAEGERPVLVLPPGLSATESDLVFGWALVEAHERSHGWLATLRLALAHRVDVGEAALD